MTSTGQADLSRITVIPGQRSGQPCIRGLRVTVWDVLDMLAAGMTESEILDDFPYLEKDDFPAVYAYAAQTGRTRPDEMESVVVRNPEIMSGEPTFRGTRVLVRTLFDYIETGSSLEDFLLGFPTVTREAALAALDQRPRG